MTHNKNSLSRRRFLKTSCLVGFSAAVPGFHGRAIRAADDSAKKPILDESDLTFLKEIAAKTIDEARVRPGESRAGMPANDRGITMITPGGNYPAFWIRDFAMSLDCGLIGVAEILPMLRLTCRSQNGEKERLLKSGGIIPPFAIPDHINFDGGAVFYPGTFSSGEDQGENPWGPLPPMDDHFYFVHIAYAVWRDSHDAKFLEESVEGMSVFDRLVRAFHSPASDQRTGAAITTKDRRAVGFGFQDSVYVIGSLSFTTLLRYRAAKQLAELSQALGKKQASEEFAAIAEKIASHFAGVFAMPDKKDGWLLAATEVGRQPDVWATLFALHLGILPREAADRARSTVAAAVKSPGNTVEYEGAARHVPADRYFSPEKCWETAYSGVNTYQSGAFWHTPTGWLVEALEPVDTDLARQVARCFMQHLRERDFRKGEGRGAPWECFGIDMVHAQNPVYMTSVTLPLAVLAKI
jgi:hypothetical protein